MPLIFLLVLAAWSLPAFAQNLPPSQYKDDSVYKKLDGLAPQGFAVVSDEVEDLLARQNNQKTNAAILEWLRDNTLYHHILKKDQQTFDTLYFAMYSDLLYKLARSYRAANHEKEYMALSKSALMPLYVFNALAVMDAKRCKDKSVMGPVMQMMRFRYDALKDVITSMKQEEVAEIYWRIAHKVEDQLKDRPPNKAICSSGMAKTVDLLNQSGVEKRVIEDPSYIGGKKTELIAPEGYEYQPKYIDKKEWASLRNETHASQRLGWEKHYDHLKNPKK